jgi:hypothetical protein
VPTIAGIVLRLGASLAAAGLLRALLDHPSEFDPAFDAWLEAV